jgi:signal transduction histidine kinase
MDTGGLPEAFLAGCPAIQWLADREGRFHRIYGDPTPLFAKPASELIGESAADSAWRDRYSRVFAGEVVRLRERRGDSLWHVSLFPVGGEGAILFAGGLAQDASAWGAGDQQLRTAAFRAMDSQESVRNTIARFLHDSIGQNFTALGLQLDLVRMDLEAGGVKVLPRIGEIQKLLGQMMEEVRVYINQLNPSMVDRSGLATALERLSTRIRGGFSGVVRVNVDPSLRLDLKLASALYTVAKEAAENALQHSGCTTLEITVQSTSTGTSLEVRDDGSGFDSGDLAGGFRGLGLLCMEHYAAQAGLELSIASSRESGTVVRAITMRGHE